MKEKREGKELDTSSSVTPPMKRMATEYNLFAAHLLQTYNFASSVETSTFCCTSSVFSNFQRFQKV